MVLFLDDGALSAVVFLPPRALLLRGLVGLYKKVCKIFSYTQDFGFQVVHKHDGLLKPRRTGGWLGLFLLVC